MNLPLGQHVHAVTGAPLSIRRSNVTVAVRLTLLLSLVLITPASLWAQVARPEIVVQLGHSGALNAVAYSPDGRLALTGGADGTARLWDVNVGRELRILAGHRGPVTSVAFAPDGRTAATAGVDGTARLWELATGKELHRFEGHVGRVNAVAFTPDAKSVVTAGDDKTVRIWDLSTGSEVRRLDHVEEVRAAAVSPDARLIAAGCAGGTTYLWDARTGREVRRYIGHKDAVVAVAFAPDGSALLTGSLDTSARLWSMESAQELRRFTGQTQGLTSVGFSPDGRLVVAGGRDSSTTLWQVQTGRMLARLMYFSDGTWAVVDADGRYDASNGGDVDAVRWQVGDESLALSQFKERYYEPGLFTKLVNGEPLRDVSALKEVKLFPKVEYDPPAPGSTQLKLKLTNRGGGIGRVQVFVNNKEIVSDARKGSVPQGSLAVDLANAPVVAGKPNEIRVVTWNEDGYLASRGEVRQWIPIGPADDRPPQLHAIVVGVSNYGAAQLRLHYPDKDASDIAKALTIAASRLLGADNVHVSLFNTSDSAGAVAPTKANLSRAFLDAQKNTRPQDIFVVYLAGHGAALAGTDAYYYLTKDARGFADLDDPALRAQTAISSDELTEWLKLVPALKQIMVLDTCAAGAAAIKLVEKRAQSADQIRAVERLKDRTGFHILMGSAANASSYEASQYGQGLLTYSLLQGMKGAALRNDEYVDVSKLFQYAADEVPQLATNVGGIQKPIVAAPRGTSFDFGQLKLEDKQAIPLATVKPIILRPTLLNADEGVDTLQLMIAVRKSLDEESFVATRDAFGDSRPGIVYVDADELPGAVIPSGTYTVVGDKVLVRLVLRRDGQVVNRFQVEGSTQDVPALAARLTSAIKGAAQPSPN